GSLLRYLETVRVACIIEGGSADEREGQRTMHYGDRADNLVLVFRCTHLLDGHEVSHLTDTAIRQEAREQEVALWQVELLAGDTIHGGGRDAEKATFSHIEQRPKDTGRVEAWEAAPVDGAVLAHQGHGVRVADDRIVLYRQVGGHSLASAARLC